jgi:hypothetical protein
LKKCIKIETEEFKNWKNQALTPPKKLSNKFYQNKNAIKNHLRVSLKLETLDTLGVIM